MVRLRGESTLVNMNGPLDGGGLLVASLSRGVVCGMGAANISPRMLSNVPFGSFSWIVMSPVLSSVVMPLIVWAVPAAYSLAPTITS